MYDIGSRTKLFLPSRLQMNQSSKIHLSYIPEDLSWWWDSDQLETCHDVNRQWQLNVLAFLGNTFNLKPNTLIRRGDSL